MVRAMLAVGTATAVSVALALTGCAGEGDETGAGADGPAAPEATEATRTTATTGPTTTTTTSPTATTPPPAPRPATVMPGVVCRNLQEAQDTIQRAGVSLSHSEDATGQGRL